MSGVTEDQLLELTQKKHDLLNEILSVAEEQTRFCMDNDIEVFIELVERRNKLVEKLKKTDVVLQRYLKQNQLSTKRGQELEAYNGNSAVTIRKILAADEVNQKNIKQAMEMIKGKKGSLKTNKQGVVKYYKTASYPAAGVYTDSKG